MNSQPLPDGVDICTLFEGDYHLGVAALLNSLHAGGFRGRFWIGYRGILPSWLGKTGNLGSEGQLSVGGIDIRTVPLAPGRHLTHCKPRFMLDLLRRPRHENMGIIYFDPDIISLAPWSFYVDWISNGVALCEDCTFPRMPTSHPFRAHWEKLIISIGRSVTKMSDYYINGGFIGVHRNQASFLETWDNLIEAIALRPGIDMNRISSGSRFDPFCIPDQDTLNAAVMASDINLSTVGPDGMGFTPGGFIMQHAITSPKPWRGKYIYRIIRSGVRPAISEKLFWKNVRGVVQPLTARRVLLSKLDLLFAIAVSRVYRA